MPPAFSVNVGYVLTLWCYIVITIAVITFALSFVLCWILQIVEQDLNRKRVEIMRSAAKMGVEPQRSHSELDPGLQMNRESEIPVARSQDQPYNRAVFALNNEVPAATCPMEVSR